MKHAAIFTRLAKRVDPNIPILEAAMGEIEALEKDYQQACLLVSQMHRAAMNDVIGPKRGVVEDILDLREERDELKAMNDELKQVRCEGCGYLVTEREHLGCHSEKTLKALAAAEESFNQQHRINAELVEQAELLAAQNEALRSALEEVKSLIGETTGVYGLHLNGDLSPWAEIEQGGRFERLTLLDDALNLPNLATPPAVPSGMCLVPKEPTERMLEEAYVFGNCMLQATNKCDPALLYKAMIAAAQGEQE